MNKKTFWKIIKELNWDGSYKACSKKLLEKHKNNEIDLQDFYNQYMNFVFLINQETERRIDNNKECFEAFVSYGADDCHFIDLPGELIGRGQSEVKKYLAGKYLVSYEPRECFTYMFHSFIDKNLIKQ